MSASTMEPATSTGKCNVTGKNQVIKFMPDVMSTYSNSSGTVSYGVFRGFTRTAFRQNRRRAKTAVQPVHEFHEIVEESMAEKAKPSPTQLNGAMLLALNKHIEHENRRLCCKPIIAPIDTDFNKTAANCLKEFLKTPGDQTFRASFGKDEMTVQIVDNEDVRRKHGGLTRQTLEAHLAQPNVVLNEGQMIKLRTIGWKAAKESLAQNLRRL